MQTVSSFHFLLERSGAPAFIDTDSYLAFRRAEGDFQSPDRARATVRVIGPGVVAEVDSVSIAESQWETNALSGEWQKLPPNWGFNPASLFDQSIGIQSILESDLQDLELRGFEELDVLPGKLLYALTGRLAGERLHRLSYGMIGPEDLEIVLWIAPQSFELHRMTIVHQQLGQSEETFWTLDFWDFNQPIYILPPIMDEGTDA